MEKVEFTHYGWFGLCPVILANIDTDCPTIEARWAFLDWFFTFSEFLQNTYIDLRTKIDAGYEPYFSITVSGKFKETVIIEYED